MSRAVILIIIVALMGCARLDKSFTNFADIQNERKIRGCYDVDLVFSGGGGLGAGVNGSIHARGVVVTGGQNLKNCAEYRQSLRGGE